MRFPEVITSIKTVPPSTLSAEDAEEWVRRTDTYGFPMYKYPFWFWDVLPEDIEAGLVSGGTRTKTVSCHPFLFPSADDIYACSVWNDTPGDELPWATATPIYMNDPNAYAVALRDGKYEVVVEEDDETRAQPIHVAEPSHEPHPEAVEEHKKKAQKRKADTGWTTLYAAVGLVGAAILYKAMKKK